jgi:hypothetical protein
MDKAMWKSKMGKPPLPRTSDMQRSDLDLDLTGSTWDKYFESTEEIAIPSTANVFRVYKSGPTEGTLFVLLHGAGHSALSWAFTVVRSCI